MDNPNRFCPDPKCHEQIAMRLEEKMPKSWLWKAATVFLVPALIFAAILWGDFKSQDLRFEKLRDADKTRTSVRVLQNEIKNINERLMNIETGQQGIKADIKEILRRTKDAH